MINDLRKSLLDRDRLPSLYLGTQLVIWGFLFTIILRGIPLCHCLLFSIPCISFIPLFWWSIPSGCFWESMGEKLDLEYLSMSVFCYAYWIECWVKNSSGNHFLSKFWRLSSVIEKSILILDPFMWLVFLPGSAVYCFVPGFWNCTTYIVGVYFHRMGWVFGGPFQLENRCPSTLGSFLESFYFFSPSLHVLLMLFGIHKTF